MKAKSILTILMVILFLIPLKAQIYRGNPDSSITFSGSNIPHFKTTYTYDSNNNQTIKLEKYWMGGTDWEDSYIYQSIYNVNNKLLEYIQLHNNGINWDTVLQKTYTYDANDNLLTYIVLNDISSGFVSSWETYTYDSNNNKITLKTKQSSDHVNWDSISYIQYNYDIQNNLLTQLLQMWNGIAWSNFIKDYYNYDINNNLVSHYSQTWDGISIWNNTSRDTTYYDANNNDTLIISEFWDGSNWMYSKDVHKEFNTSNILISEVGNLGAGETYTNNYDSNGNPIYTYSSHSNGGGTFIENQSFLTYDADNNTTDIVNQNQSNFNGWNISDSTHYFYHSAVIPTLIAPSDNSTGIVITGTTLQWNSVGSATSYEYQIDDNASFSSPFSNSITSLTATTGTLLENTTYYWRVRANDGSVNLPWSTIWSFSTEPISALNNVLNTDNFYIYPNPSKGIFTISTNGKIKSLEIYDLLGQLIFKSEKLNPITQIDIGNKPNGIYYLKFYSDKTVLLKQMIVE